MTAKRKQDKTRSAKQPKLNKETVKDLDPKDKGADVQGGIVPNVPSDPPCEHTDGCAGTRGCP